jgi:hypothetical protein
MMHGTPTRAENRRQPYAVLPAMHHARALDRKLGGEPLHVGDEVLRCPGERLGNVRGHGGAAQVLELRQRGGQVHGVAGWWGCAGQLWTEKVELGTLAEPQTQEPDRAAQPLRQALEDIDKLALGAAPGQRRIGM